MQCTEVPKWLKIGTSVPRHFDTSMELDANWEIKFRERLDKSHIWPSLYTFKFIVKAGMEDDVRQLFPLHTDTARASQKGNYISLTFQMMMPSSDAVISVYRKAGTIEGIIAL